MVIVIDAHLFCSLKKRFELCFFFKGTTRVKRSYCDYLPDNVLYTVLEKVSTPSMRSVQKQQFDDDDDDDRNRFLAPTPNTANTK